MTNERNQAMREWTEDMGEISGFGGSYEGACRVMVLAGIDWFEQNKESNPRFGEYENVTGIIDANNDAAKAMVKHMIDAADAYAKECGDGGGVTGAMVQYTVHHAMYAFREGWEKYQRLRREMPVASGCYHGKVVN